MNRLIPDAGNIMAGIEQPDRCVTMTAVAGCARRELR
jgi:hypothetical protein